jgi:hypothetical protein
MKQVNIDEVSERVARLEREVRRWKRFSAAAFALLSATILLSYGREIEKARAAVSAPEDLKVRRLIVVDKNGNPRILLDVKPPPFGAEVGLVDENGNPRGGFTDQEEGGALFLDDKYGKAGVALGSQKGGAGLVFFDRSGKGRVNLGIVPGGSVLSLSDENEKQRVLLSEAKVGPSLDLFDENERSRAVFGATSLENPNTGASENTGPSSIVLFGTNGKTIWRAP